MIGRTAECEVLEDSLHSKRPEFLVLFGRRRVGKTYLIKEFFHERFAFYATGIHGQNTRKQLKMFQESLSEFGDRSGRIPKDWLEAFSRLRMLLELPDVQREHQSGKRVVFLDELPWMDTPKSDFKSALDYFWNRWGSSQKDLVLIVCGSATSWIMNNIIKDTGGFYNRITRQIHLNPFCLKECRQFLESNGILMTDRQLIESYMVFGGIPYYLGYFKSGDSLAQSVEKLFFGENAPLRYEFDQLFASLYKNADRYIAIIKALFQKRGGLTRQELLHTKGIVEGKDLTKCLLDLEQCDFIRKYRDVTREKNGCFYQLTDPLSLFCLFFLEPGKVNSWIDFLNTPGYHTWCGLSYEIVCPLHIKQIKNALGIAGISSQEYAWRSKKTKPGTQIDLLIDRKDDVINLCEIKYSAEMYAIDAAYHKELIHKVESFRKETGTKKALMLTMITCEGIERNKYREVVVKELTAKDLFA